MLLSDRPSFSIIAGPLPFKKLPGAEDLRHDLFKFKWEGGDTFLPLRELRLLTFPESTSFGKLLESDFVLDASAKLEARFSLPKDVINIFDAVLREFPTAFNWNLDGDVAIGSTF